MSGTPGCAMQNVFGSRLQFLPIREKQNRIEISLHSTFEIEIPPAVIQWNAPVKPNHFGASFAHRGQKSRAVGSKINDRYLGSLQCLHKFSRARKHVTPIVFHAEAADPTI